MIRKMKPLFLTITILITAVLLSACGDVDANKKLEEQRTAQAKAVAEFITSDFSGWTLEGTSTKYGTDCSDVFPCDLHLSRDTESTVVSVMIRKFKRPDGSEYWHVWKTRPIDIEKEESKTDGPYDDGPPDNY
jgi:hypothetical protein